MENLSLHVLDVTENSVRAGAKNITIEVKEDEESDWLSLRIVDDGEGMDETTSERARDPFYTSKEGRRTGLGLPLLEQACTQADGEMTIRSRKGGGTEVVAGFKLSHPDAVPMGDMLETIAVLITGNPDIRFVYDYRKGDEKCHFDSSEG